MAAKVHSQVGATLARAAVCATALLSFDAIDSRSALAAYNPLQWGSGNAFSNTGLGPVISPQIVPIFWGDWKTWEGSGAGYDPRVIRKYLNGLAGWVSGVGAPLGYEPVVRQYGVVGANVLPQVLDFPVSGGIGDADIVNAIHGWQSQGLVPPNSPSTIFAVFVKGFQNYTWVSPTTCGYHTVNHGTYYAVIPWDGCGGSNTNGFQKLTSHELLEAMTDPAVGSGALGWVTHEDQFLGFPTTWKEGADECQNLANSTAPHPFDSNPLPFGLVQNFSDNTARACMTWTPSVSPHFGLTRRSNTQLDVVFLNSISGALGHAYLDQNYAWRYENIDASPGQVVGAPVTVSPSSGRLDVFARVFAGDKSNSLVQMNGLSHWSENGTNAWTAASKIHTFNGRGGADSGSGIGPLSAVSWGPNRIDLFTGEIDGSVLHFAANDSNTFVYDNNGGFSIGPTTVVSRGNNTLDVFSYRADGFPQVDSWNSTNPSGHTNAWSAFYEPGNSGPMEFMRTGTLLTPVAWNPQADGTLGEIDLFHAFGPNYHGFDVSTGWRSALESYATVAGAGIYYGAVSTAAYQDGSEYVVVWQTTGNDYLAVHKVGAAFPDVGISLGGAYRSPPSVIYGTDGYPEVLGIGQDGCLWETYLDYWSGGPVVNGPSPTGVCGLL